MSHEINTQINDTSSDETTKKGLVSKLIKIAIIIAVLIILFFISIGIVKVVPKFISSISGAAVYLSSNSSEGKITVTPAEKEVASKSNIKINWKNTSEKEGSQYWSFKCTPGILIQYQSVDGQGPVVCETLFPLPSQKEGSYSFYVESKNTSDTEVPFTISFYDKDRQNVLLSDSNSVTIVQEDNTTNTLNENNQYNPTPTANTVPNTTTQPRDTDTNQNNNNNQKTVYYGNPDLSITVIEAGVIGINGRSYSPISEARGGDSIIVRFRISNLGTSPSGLWVLNASLPASNTSDRNFTSNYEPSLRPGDSYEMNIVFNGFDGSVSNAIVLNVVSTNEKTTSNNSLKIPVPTSSNNNNNDTDYNTGERADLRLNILDTGIVDSRDRYYETDSLDQDNTIGIRFEITNVGGRDSGSFEIKADLPTQNNDTYNKKVSSMKPGEKREFIIGFDNPDTGRNDIYIEIDSDDDVSESNENNNDDSIRIDVDN